MGSVPSGARSAVRAARRSARSFGSRASARSAARRWLGTGSTTVAIARRLGPTAHRVGVDISEPMQAATPWPTTFICADAQTYPLEQGSFDLIVSRSTHAPSSAGHRNLWRWSDPRCVGRAPEPMVKALLGGGNGPHADDHRPVAHVPQLLRGRCEEASIGVRTTRARTSEMSVRTAPLLTVDRQKLRRFTVKQFVRPVQQIVQ
jgi:Methyltransferase domain